MSVLVLTNEWNRGDDPIRFFFDNGICLDLNQQGYKPRSVLVECGCKTINDCVYNVPYDVTVCNIIEQQHIINQ